MTNHKLSKTIDLLQQGVQDKLHMGAQLYVSIRDETVVDLAIGSATPNRNMQRDTLQCWLSCSKPVTSVSLAQLRERSLLEWDDPVTRFLPEFDQHGKADITVRHLLTHTAGIRSARTGWPKSDWHTSIDQICATRPEPRWPPGEKAGYDVSGAWFILAEIVQRASGTDFPEYVRENVFSELRMENSWIGMSQSTYDTYRHSMSDLFDTSSDPPEPMSKSDLGILAKRCKPGGGGFGPAHELGKFYEALLSGVRGKDSPVLTSKSVCELVLRHRLGMWDHTFKADMDWGLGFMLHSSQSPSPQYPYGFGAHASHSTFGHGGAQSASSFVDPDKELVVVWICNGRPGELTHQRRNWSINCAIYEDLFE